MIKKIKNFSVIKKIMSVLILIAVVIGGGFGYNVYGKNSESTSSVDMAEYIRTTTLSKNDIIQSIETSGTVESSGVITVNNEIAGTVETINVSVGDTILKGDVLLTLETEDIYDSISNETEKLQEAKDNAYDKYMNAYADYETAVSNTSSQYSVMVDAKEDSDEKQVLFEAAEAEVEDYQTDYENSLANYKVIYEEIATLEITMNEAKTNVEAIEDEIAAKELEISTLEAEEIASYNENNDPDVTTYAELVESDEHITLEADLVSLNDELTTANSEYTIATDAYNNKIATNELSEANEKINETESILKQMKTIVSYSELESSYNTAYKLYESELSSYENCVDKEEVALENKENYEDDYNEAVADTGNLDDYYEELNSTKILASDTGVITSINTTVGSHLSVNTNVASIEDTTSLEIYVDIEEYDILNVETGMKVLITTDANDKTISGEIIAVSTTASSNSQSSSFGATVKVTGDTSELLIGMNANCEIVINSTEGVYSVPVDAIETLDNKSYVYVLTSGTTIEDAEFEKIEVTTGEDDGYNIEINGNEVKDGLQIRSSAVLEESILTTEDTSFGFTDKLSGQTDRGSVSSSSAPSAPSSSQERSANGK